MQVDHLLVIVPDYSIQRIQYGLGKIITVRAVFIFHQEYQLYRDIPVKWEFLKMVNIDPHGLLRRPPHIRLPSFDTRGLKAVPVPAITKGLLRPGRPRNKER